MTAQEQDVPTIPWLDLSHAVRSDACVLFTGDEETAEVLARRVHVLSGWRQGPFVPVDCGQPADALEASLTNLDDESAKARLSALAQRLKARLEG